MSAKATPTVFLRAADVLARRLYEAGCRYAFGIPGGEVLTLVDALERAGIRFVLAKHENAAGFMAEGVHHRTGAPAVLVATLGPGAANAVNVVANAEQDRVPLLVLTGCVDADEAAGYTHQVLDHQALFRPITKASFRFSAGSADAIADKAVAIAGDDRPGPVHIDVPIAVAAAEAPGNRPTRRAVNAPVAPAPGPDLDTARQWLAAAQRPLIVAGLDAVQHDAGAALQGLARETGAPVITTYKAKGLLDEDDPLSLGGAGLSPVADKLLLPWVAEADLVLAAGYDPIEMRPGWHHPWDPDRQRVIELSAAPNTHYMHQAGLSFVCDIGAGLDALRGADGAPATWSADRLQHGRAALRRAFGADEAWGPAAVVETVRDRLPRDGIATVDSGAHRILLNQLWRCHAPRTLLQSNGLCTMGCALPLAIGSKLAAPERAVAAFTGDAGLLMVLGELATAVELALPIAVVVFVDRSLALIELKQRDRQLAKAGVSIGAIDCAALGPALGGHGVTVASRADLAAALDAAFAAERFTLIGCTIDATAYDGRI